MFNSIMMLMFLMPQVAMLNMAVNQTHFLMTLLSLEGITLSLVLLVPASMSMINMSSTSIMIIIPTFGACEASLGCNNVTVVRNSHIKFINNKKMLSLQLMYMSMILLPMITTKYMWISSTAMIMSLLPMFMILMNNFSYVMNSSFMAYDLMSSSLSILTVWVTP